MVRPAILGFYGESNSGKTTLLVNIIEELKKEGFSVATIKNTNKNIQIDKKGKDTWKHRHAGADVVSLSSPDGTIIIMNQGMDEKNIAERICAYQPIDVILIEGARDPIIPKIQIGKGEKRDNTIMQYQDDFQKVMAIIKQEIDQRKKKQKIDLEVNGKKIGLTEFPADMITATLVGMLSSLKGIDEIHEINLHLQIEK